MTANRLTNSRLASALKLGRKTWLTDDESIRNRGRLLARISNSSTALFYFRYSLCGRYRSISLGPHSTHARAGYLTLEQARDEAARLSALYRNAETRDVREALKQNGESSAPAKLRTPAPPEPPAASISLLALVELYHAQLKADGKVSWKDVAGIARRGLAPSVVSQKPASAVTSDDIVELLRPLIARAKREAAKLRAALNAAFEAAMRSRFDAQFLPEWKLFAITSNPVRAVGKIHCKNTKDRALNGRDLGLLWLHLHEGKMADSIGYRFLRINILLGGQRCEQLLRVKPSDIDEYARTVTLLDGKGARTSPRRHVLPLSDLVWQEIAALAQIAKAQDSDFIFPGRTGNKAALAQGISHIASDIGRELASMNFGGRPMERFTYGDLRRTTESRMGELDISKDMRAQLLSHGLSGVQEAHYDRYDYKKQKRQALMVWEAYVLEKAEEQRGAYVLATSGK